MPCKDNVSEVCNKLADKHNVNVTKMRDIVEDLRRIVFRKTKRKFGVADGEGFDLYMGLRDENYCWTTKLNATKRRAAK